MGFVLFFSCWGVVCSCRILLIAVHRVEFIHSYLKAQQQALHRYKVFEWWKTTKQHWLAMLPFKLYNKKKILSIIYNKNGILCIFTIESNDRGRLD